MLNKLKTYVVNALKTCLLVGILGLAVGCALCVIVPVALAFLAVIGVVLVIGLITAVVAAPAVAAGHTVVTVNGKRIYVDGKPVEAAQDPEPAREPDPEKPDTPEAKAPVNPENQGAAQ